jgi:glutamine synthetase
MKMIEDNEVKFIDFRFTDTIGKEQHVSVPAHTINAEKLEEGQMFDGSSIAGWKPINESDMIMKPDTWLPPSLQWPNTFVSVNHAMNPQVVLGNSRL